MLLAVILVVAAVEQELAGADGARTLCCGIGPVEAAAATAAALAGAQARAVVHLGIAGMRAGAGLQLLDTVIGDEAVYEDRAARSSPARLRPDPRMLAAAQRALPAAAVRSIGTSARVGGTSECAVEAMEGYAVLRAAQLAGVPAIEVRVISNEIAESDRARWRFDEAFAAIAALTGGLVQEVRGCVS
jgi:futalosine hydrolase